MLSTLGAVRLTALSAARGAASGGSPLAARCENIPLVAILLPAKTEDGIVDGERRDERDVMT